MGRLILTRYKDEAVVVRGNGETRITVFDVGAGKVRLSFEADPEIEIDRAEVREAKDRDARRDGRGEGRG